MTHLPLRYATPVALALALTACSGVKVDNTTNTSTDTTMTTTDNMAGDSAGGMGNAMSDMVNPTPTAQAFADTAARSDAFEIAAAKLAQRNGASADVKAFAAKMIAAHTDSTLKIKQAAAAAAPAVTPDPTLSDDQNAKLADLGKLKGADFDKAYASGQVAAHEDALALMKTYAAGGDAPTLKTAAGEITPVVQEHLEMAKALEAK